MPQATKYHCSFGFPGLVPKLTKLPIFPNAFVFTKTYVNQSSVDDCRRKFMDFVTLIAASDQSIGSKIAGMAVFRVETE